MGAAVLERYQFRKARVRRRLLSQKTIRPRLSVYRSLKHIYAQIIDDTQGRTLASASSLSPELKGALKTGGNMAAAEKVGELMAQKAKAAGVQSVVFDRGGRRYHGCIKALADAARKAGLQF